MTPTTDSPPEKRIGYDTSLPPDSYLGVEHVYVSPASSGQRNQANGLQGSRRRRDGLTGGWAGRSARLWGGRVGRGAGLCGGRAGRRGDDVLGVDHDLRLFKG